MTSIRWSRRDELRASSQAISFHSDGCVACLGALALFSIARATGRRRDRPGLSGNVFKGAITISRFRNNLRARKSFGSLGCLLDFWNEYFRRARDRFDLSAADPAWNFRDRPEMGQHCRVGMRVVGRDHARRHPTLRKYLVRCARLRPFRIMPRDEDHFAAALFRSRNSGGGGAASSLRSCTGFSFNVSAAFLADGAQSALRIRNRCRDGITSTRWVCDCGWSAAIDLQFISLPGLSPELCCLPAGRECAGGLAVHFLFEFGGERIESRCWVS